MNNDLINFEIFFAKHTSDSLLIELRNTTNIK